MGIGKGRIFISYSSSDSAAADAVVGALDEVGLKPWIDKREIKPGESFLSRMNDALVAAHYIVVLFSRNALNSTWVAREWQAGLNKGATLIPVRTEEVEVPPLIADLVRVDLFPNLEAGIQKLKSFFEAEIGTEAAETEDRRSGAQPGRRSLAERSRRELRLVSIKCVRETDFDAFLFDMDMDRGEVQGPSLNARLLWLLHSTSREGTTADFAKWLELERKDCVKRALTEFDAEETS